MADTPNNQELLSDADFGAVKAPKIEGEGSYDATREYNERTKRFIDQQGAHIEELANDDAETEGLTKARH